MIEWWAELHGNELFISGQQRFNGYHPKLTLESSNGIEEWITDPLITVSFEETVHERVKKIPRMGPRKNKINPELFSQRVLQTCWSKSTISNVLDHFWKSYRVTPKWGTKNVIHVYFYPRKGYRTKFWATVFLDLMACDFFSKVI